MSAVPTTSFTGTREISRKGHIGLVVLGSIASGLLLGLALVLVVLADGPEHEILGAALVALGTGFVLLAVGSSRLTDQPQAWALTPGAITAVVGLSILLLPLSGHVLALTGWLWPLLLLGLVVWSVRGARGHLSNWSRRVVLYPTLLVLLLVAAGGAFETVAEATSSNSPVTGRTYLVNGQHLYLDCVGHGSPTVVLLNGLGERTPSWAWVQRDVSSASRVCTYDRRGEGWSSGTPGSGSRQFVTDLHDLLAAAHVPGPYVLAGHSVGGIYALLYAARYPQDVAGLALIDSSTPYQFDLPDYPMSYEVLQPLTSVLPSLARTGVMRLATSSAAAGLPPQAQSAAHAFATSPRDLTADHAEVEQLPQMFDEAKALTSIGGKPLAVVTALSGAMRGWAAAQDRLAKLSTMSFHLTVPTATHETILEDRAFAHIAGNAIARVVHLARTERG